MSSLIHAVLTHVQRVKQRPTVGSDPDELKHLETAAHRSWGDSFAALHAPVASLTWETRALLLGSTPTSDRVYIDFPGSSDTQLVGIYVSLSTKPGATGATPTRDDIDVFMDVNEKSYLTSLRNAKGQGPTSTTKDATYVTLSAIGVQTPRLFGLRIEGPNPQVGFTFRWKWGANVYADTIIGVAAFVRHLREGEHAFR